MCLTLYQPDLSEAKSLCKTKINPFGGQRPNNPATCPQATSLKGSTTTATATRGANPAAPRSLESAQLTHSGAQRGRPFPFHVWFPENRAGGGPHRRGEIMAGPVAEVPACHQPRFRTEGMRRERLWWQGEGQWDQGSSSRSPGCHAGPLLRRRLLGRGCAVRPACTRAGGPQGALLPSEGRGASGLA